MTTQPRILERHFGVLDGLRGSVFLIMLKHFSEIRDPHTLPESVYHAFADIGIAGIDVFFFVSGFLITGILLDAKGGSGYFQSFYTRRVLRIFPLYYAFLLVWFVVLARACPCPRRIFMISPGRSLLYWTYTTNVGMALGGWDALTTNTQHLWSLAVEEQFYLIWPAVVWLWDREGIKRVCLICVIAAPLLRMGWIMASLPAAGAYALTPMRMDSLACGALLVLFFRDEGGLARFRPLARVVALTGLAGLIAIYAGTGHLHPRQTITLVIGLTLSTWTAAAVVVLAMTAAPGSWMHRTLTNRPLVAIGTWSYAMYVLHYPLAPALRWLIHLHAFVFSPYLHSRLLADVAYVLVMMAISALAGFVSRHAFEKHFLKLRRFFPYARHEEEATATAPVAVRVAS